MRNSFHIVHCLIFVFIGLWKISLPVFAQVPLEREKLEQELVDLNQQLRKEGENDNHPQVEAIMDSMIDLMHQLRFPDEDIRKRAHLRVRYGMSVNRLGSAHDAAESWLRTHPDDIVIWDLLGTITERMNRYLESKKALTVVYDSNPDHDVYQRRLLHVLTALGDAETALDVCAHILRTHDDNPRSLIRVINSYLRFFKVDEAVSAIDLLEKCAPDDPFLPYARGRTHYELGEYEKAIEFFSKINKSNYNWYDAAYRRGLCLSQLRRFDEAAHIFVDLLSTNPYDMRTYPRLEQTLARLRKRKGALLVRKIRQQLKEESLIDGEANYIWRTGDVVNSALLRALANDLRGRFSQSGAVLLEACHIVPDSTQAKKNLTQHFFATLQACRAEELCRRILKKPPPSEKERIGLDLAVAHLRQDQPTEPIRLFENAPVGSPLRRSLQTRIGTYYLDIKGDPHHAIAYLKDIKNASPSVLAALARSYLELGDYEKALAFFDRLPESFTDPITRISKVQCLALLGKKDQANSLFQQTLSSQPNLSPLITARARAALAVVNEATDQAEQNKTAQEIDEILKTIRQTVIDAHRLGWPKSIPKLLELSNIYAGIGHRDTALQYAQLAFEGDTGQIDSLIKVIELMNQPERIFVRLHLIRTAQANENVKRDFDKEIAEVFSHMELTPKQ